jgi:ribonuclease R
VEVKLMEVAPIKGGLRFEIISDGKTGKPMKRMAKPQFRQSKRRR